MSEGREDAGSVLTALQGEGERGGADGGDGQRTEDAAGTPEPKFPGCLQAGTDGDGF